MPNSLALRCASGGKQDCFEEGWARTKARDARGKGADDEGQAALAHLQYMLDTCDARQMHIHLNPLVSKKFVETSFERFKG